MAGGVKGIPDNSSVVMPRLFCRDVAAEIDFCKSTFGAVELGRRPGPNGNAAHALMTIGPAMIMIEAEWAGLATRAPKADGSSPVVIFVYVEDVDKTMERAVAGGAKVLFPVENQFWGDRIGWVMDPSGHVWTIATRIEETTETERKKRWSAKLAGADSLPFWPAVVVLGLAVSTLRRSSSSLARLEDVHRGKTLWSLMVCVSTMSIGAGTGPHFSC